MAGSRTVSEVVVVVLLRAQSSSSKLLGVVEGGLCSGVREVHESVLSMTGFNIEPVFYAKAYIPSRDIGGELLLVLGTVELVEVFLIVLVDGGPLFVELATDLLLTNVAVEPSGSTNGKANEVREVLLEGGVHSVSFQSRVFNILWDFLA